MRLIRPCFLPALALLASCAASPASPAAAPTAAPPPVAATPAPPHLFEGCTASPLGGVGWAYACDGFAATVADVRKAEAAALLDGNTRGVRESLAGKMEATFDESNATYELAGRQVQGRRLSVTANGAVIMRSDAAVVPVDGAGLRMVACGGQPDARVRERCKALLEILARAAWRDDAVRGVPVENDAVTLAGRAVSVPKGCTASKEDSGAMIRCDGAPTLFWLEDVADPAAEREHFFASTTGAHDRIGCTLDSVAAECDTVSDATGIAYRAVARLRGRSVVVYCIAPGKTLPPACAAVLTTGAPR